MPTTTLASPSAAKSSRDYYWLLANGDKTGNFIDPNEDQFDLPFNNRTRPDISRKHAEKTIIWVDPGDRFIGYASTPNRVMALFEVTANVPGDGIKFRRIKLLATPVEWSALTARLGMHETHWPKSSKTQLHKIEKHNVGTTIWNVINKLPGTAKPTDSRESPSLTNENKTDVGPPVQATNVAPSNAAIANDGGESNEDPNYTVEPNAFDDLKAHEAELNDISDETEREEVRKSRIGQGRFRKDLIKHWDGVCAVTGCAEQRILRASHIKPWRDCKTKEERLGHFNGLLLAPHLDALFDGGFISFDESGRILLSKEFSEEDQRLLGVNKDLALRLVDNLPLDDRTKEYLRFHRENRLRPRPAKQNTVRKTPEN